MAIPKKFKFRVKNETGVSILANELTIKWDTKTWDSSTGKVSYATQANLTNAASIANNTWGDIGAAFDNTTVGAFELEGRIEAVISTATPNGDLTLKLFGDQGGGFADDENEQRLLAVMNVTVTTIKSVDFKAS